MAYRKKTYKKKTYRKRPSRALSAPRVRRAIINIAEKKFVNTSIATRASMTAVTNAWLFTSCIAGIQQGTSASDRIGNKAYIHSITVRFSLIPSFVTVVSGVQCRFVMYHNKEAVAALPGPTTVWTTDTFNSQRNLTLKPRVSLLKDMTMAHVNTTTTSGGPPYMMACTIYPKKIVDFQSSAGTISDLFKDDYGFGWCADANSCCQYYGTVQVVFSDV